MKKLNRTEIKALAKKLSRELIATASDKEEAAYESAEKEYYKTAEGKSVALLAKIKAKYSTSLINDRGVVNRIKELYDLKEDTNQRSYRTGYNSTSYYHKYSSGTIEELITLEQIECEDLTELIANVKEQLG